MARKPKRERPTYAHVDNMTKNHGWFQRQLWTIESMCYGRWPYWLGICMQNSIGELPEWAIPQIPFEMCGAGGPPAFENPCPWGYDKPRDPKLLEMMGTRADAKYNIEKTFEFCYGRGDYLTALIEWWLFAFGSHNVTERPRLHEQSAVEMYHKLELHRLLAHPGDWAAHLGCEYYSKSAKSRSGWFPTPMLVCRLMAEMTYHDAGDMRCMTCNDPCIGTGATILPVSNYCLRICGQDIDVTMVRLCEWQAWMYIPWMVYGNQKMIREFREYDAVRDKPAQIVAPLSVVDAYDQPTQQQLTLF